jgi:hypothetical protein
MADSNWLQRSAEESQNNLQRWPTWKQQFEKARRDARAQQSAPAPEPTKPNEPETGATEFV